MHVFAIFAAEHIHTFAFAAAQALLVPPPVTVHVCETLAAVHVAASSFAAEQAEFVPPCLTVHLALNSQELSTNTQL